MFPLSIKREQSQYEWQAFLRFALLLKTFRKDKLPMAVSHVLWLRFTTARLSGTFTLLPVSSASKCSLCGSQSGAKVILFDF